MFTSDKSVQMLYTVFKHILHVTSSRASTLVSRDFDSSRAEPVTQILAKWMIACTGVQHAVQVRDIRFLTCKRKEWFEFKTFK